MSTFAPGGLERVPERLVLSRVRQARPVATERTLELPSGTIESGETAAQAAARELAEECCFAGREWHELGSFWAVRAYSTEFVHVFEAAGSRRGPALDPDEDVEVERRPPEGAVAALSDAVSIAALALGLAAR